MKKIVFDLDGTLIFIGNVRKIYYERFIKKYKLNISGDELYQAIDSFEYIIGDEPIKYDQLRSHINNTLNINLDLNIFMELMNSYASIPFKRIDDVKKVLDYLAQKYELIAYTNWFTDNQITRLKLNNIYNYFSKVIGWDIVGKKPSLKGIQKIIGNDNISNYIFIGDRIDIDLEVPGSMGAETIFLNTKSIENNSYREVKDILELINIL